MSESPSLLSHFTSLPDPRIERSKEYPLVDILAIAICAVLSGAEDYVAMQEFGEARKDWLADRFGLASGIPSHDTFRRVFSLLDPQEFGKCFMAWTQALHEHTKGEVIALDGKTLRHSFDTATGQAAIHLVSAWATKQGLCLGQVKVSDKSNEITAIPALLKLLDIKGCLVTIDAMGCQKAIAAQIIDGGGDYLLSLKGNQTSLHEDVRLFFEDARAHAFFQKNPDQRINYQYAEKREKDHGRIERRRVWMVEGDEIAWLQQKEQWKGLSSLVAVQSERRIGEKITLETRYFLSSLSGSVTKVARGVRTHWGIENGLHYTLDVAFGEDASRLRKDHAPENFATLRRIALNLLKREKSLRVGVKNKRHKAGWDTRYLETVLAG
jgi:predicted transposase YbfD/YdcC